MTTFDDTRATAIIKRAQEGEMYAEGAMPESETDRITVAEQLVEQARQVEQVRQMWIDLGKGKVEVEQLVPHWPIAESILFEAHVTVGSSNGNQTSELPSAPPQSEEERPTTGSEETPETNGDWSLSQQQEEAETVTREEPKADEVWVDEHGQQWPIVSYSGGPMAIVRHPTTGEKTEVPAGFLKVKVPQVSEDVEDDVVPTEKNELVDVDSEVIDNFSGQYEFLSNFSLSPITIGDIEYPTVEHAFQAHKSLDQSERLAVAAQSTPGWAKKAGRALDLRPDWDDIKNDVMRLCLAHKFAEGSHLADLLLQTGDVELIEGNNWGDDYWGIPHGGTGQNWLGHLLEERRQELRESAKQGTFTLTGSKGTTDSIPYDATMEQIAPEAKRVGYQVVDTSIPEPDDEDDGEYRKILEETAARYMPESFPVPHQLENPPTFISIEDLVDLEDLPARTRHSEFNALAARSKLLYAVENARARDCARARKLSLRGPMRQAREALGSSSTLTERESWAEENYPEVSTWAERARKHSEDAEAFKTFFDIYSENVSVLSRDWTMRDKERQS